MTKDKQAIGESLTKEIDELQEDYSQLAKECYNYVTDEETPIDERIEFFLNKAIGKSDNEEIDKFKTLSQGDIEVIFVGKAEDPDTPIAVDVLWLILQFDKMIIDHKISREKRIPFYEEIMSYYADTIVIVL